MTSTQALLNDFELGRLATGETGESPVSQGLKIDPRLATLPAYRAATLYNLHPHWRARELIIALDALNRVQPYSAYGRPPVTCDVADLFVDLATNFPRTDSKKCARNGAPNLNLLSDFIDQRATLLETVIAEAGFSLIGLRAQSMRDLYRQFADSLHECSELLDAYDRTRQAA